MVVDDFGDVYGIFLAITGEGYSQPELRRYAEFLRRELLLATDVKKVELFGEQQELVFLEISRQRLARLGLNEDQIYAQLQARNIAADGGRVQVGDEHLALDPKGGFDSADEMLDLVIGSIARGGSSSCATWRRSSAATTTRRGGSCSTTASRRSASASRRSRAATSSRWARRSGRSSTQLKRNQPIGIEIGEINFQPEAVTAATSEFIFNLIKAVSIVIIVLLFAMGRKTGLIIGMVLFLTIMATFLVMYLDGDLLMERISLGALIIALCMLTDNAIIMIEGIKVGIEAGRDKLEVVREVVAKNQWPLFGATAIGVIAFAAIGLSDDSTGEYCNSLFWVILISLTLELDLVDHDHAAAELLVLLAEAGRGAASAHDPYGGLDLPRVSTAAGALAPLALAGDGPLDRGVRRVALRLRQSDAELLPAGDAAAVHGRRVPAGGDAHSRDRIVRGRDRRVHPAAERA